LTQNISDDEITRLLVGRVDDPELGQLRATAIFNYSTPVDPVYPTSAAEFESLDLFLNFDYYSFGATDSSDMLLQVHELQEQLTPERSYYSGTGIAYNPVPLGDTIFALGPLGLKRGWEAAIDNDPANNLSFPIPIRLDPTLGEDLLEDLISNPTLIDDFALFSQTYMGFAVTMPVGNKILGFSPLYSLPSPDQGDSRLVLTYKENGATIRVDFPIYYSTVNNVVKPVVSFTYLEANRTGTPTEGVEGFTDLVPTDGKLYAQSGYGILPKMDLTKVYQYFDTVAFPVINSAELVLDNTFTGRTPETLELLLLDSTNKYRGLSNPDDPGELDPYLTAIAEGILPLQGETVDETRVAIRNVISEGTVSVDQEVGKISLTIMTEFFQQIINHKDSANRARSFAIHPLDNEFKKTVSALKLSGSSAKLKIYYSKPYTGIP